MRASFLHPMAGTLLRLITGFGNRSAFFFLPPFSFFFFIFCVPRRKEERVERRRLRESRLWRNNATRFRPFSRGLPPLFIIGMGTSRAIYLHGITRRGRALRCRNELLIGITGPEPAFSEPLMYPIINVTFLGLHFVSLIGYEF